MKPCHNKINRRQWQRLFFGAGWVFVIVLFLWTAPRIFHHLRAQLPSYQRVNWNRLLAEKKQELSSSWQDERPLIIFAGDSEIEFGNWYDLFAGRWAIRNCGLARSKIADVTQLISAIGGQRPQILVLMCGINNLGGHDSHDGCKRDYEELLGTVRSRLQPKSILVLSVMPVRESAADHAAHQLNVNIVQFNTELTADCNRQGVEFFNVSPAVSGANGGLADELTTDGLHLNAEGYRRLAQFIAPQLARLMHTP